MKTDWRNWIAGAGIASAAALPGCIFGCVARGASVHVPGGRRRIEAIRVGDVVLAVDPETCTTHEGRVSAVRSVERETLLLVFRGGTLRLTSDHPVYCPRERVWAPAGDWGIGARRHLLLVEDDETREVTVERAEVRGEVREVFDLTVDHPLHNFVANGVLVHNKSPLERECTVNGAMTRDYEQCSCDGGGIGSVACSADGTGTCISCRDAGASLPDGGLRLDASLDAGRRFDSGPTDGGGGPADAASADGGTTDGSVGDADIADADIVDGAADGGDEDAG